jgi:hypothetical protein
MWTWITLDADTKLMASWMVGNRDAAAREFITDLARRLRHCIQLTTEGHKPYLEAVDYSFGGQIDYAMLVNIHCYSGEPEKRYSPAKCLATGRQRGNLTVSSLARDNKFGSAGVTQLVECNLAKVDVAGSNPVSRSISPCPDRTHG